MALDRFERNDTRTYHRRQMTIGMGLRRPDAVSGDLGQGDSKRSRGSIVLTLLGRSGGAEAGLAGRRTLRESFDLELQRGKGRTSHVGSKVVIKWLYFCSKVTMGGVLLHGKRCQRDHP